MSTIETYGIGLKEFCNKYNLQKETLLQVIEAEIFALENHKEFLREEIHAPYMGDKFIYGRPIEEVYFKVSEKLKNKKLKKQRYMLELQ